MLWAQTCLETYGLLYSLPHCGLSKGKVKGGFYRATFSPRHMKKVLWLYNTASKQFADVCSWRMRFLFLSENESNHCLFLFSCHGSWNGTNAVWSSEPLYGRAPRGLSYIMWKSPYQKTDEKVFLLMKRFYFADSHSLSCEVDSWVFKSAIFPSSLYMTNLNLYFGLNMAT